MTARGAGEFLLSFELCSEVVLLFLGLALQGRLSFSPISLWHE